MKALLRRTLGSLVASATLLLAPIALAEGEACYNDDDCPGGGAVCGGDVCNWSKTAAKPDGMKVFACNPAGTQEKAKDGWCTTTDDCKCKAEGATCVTTYCTFTKASDAPSGTGGAASAGAASGGSSAGGSTSAGAATGGAATAGAATAGTATKPAEPADDGGCSVSAPGVGVSGAAMALGLLGLGAMVARRRRSA